MAPCSPNSCSLSSPNTGKWNFAGDGQPPENLGQAQKNFIQPPENLGWIHENFGQPHGKASTKQIYYLAKYLQTRNIRPFDQIGTILITCLLITSRTAASGVVAASSRMP